LETCGKTLDSDDANHSQILQYIQSTKLYIDNDYCSTQNIANLERIVRNKWDDEVVDVSADFDQMFEVIGENATVADKVKQYMLLESDLERIPPELIEKLANTQEDMLLVIDAILEMAVESSECLTRCVNILVDLSVNFDKLRLSWVPDVEMDDPDDTERKEDDEDEESFASNIFTTLLKWQCEDFCVDLRRKCNDWQWQGYDETRGEEDNKVFIRSIRLCGALFKADLLNLESGHVIEKLMTMKVDDIQAIDVEALYLLLTRCGKQLDEEAHPAIIANVETMKLAVAKGGFEFRTTFMIQKLSGMIKEHGWSM